MAQKLDLHTQAEANIVFEMWQPGLSYIWLAGFIFFSLKAYADNRRTLHLLNTHKLNGCAAYFHKGRSYIYLPPDFHTTYTPAEQDLLLAHERQHITQHDPLLYRLLQMAQCVFWFNPLIHKAIRLIKQDRELLCDERVTQGRCKREYGVLLLREAQMAMPIHAIAGIAAKPGDVYERIAACAIPFPRNRKSIVIILGIAAVILAIGIMGFLMPAFESPMDIRLYLVEDISFSQHIEGAERFAFLEQGGIALDQKGLYEHALSVGLKPEQRLHMYITTGKRPTLTSYSTVSSGFEFAIHELESERLFFSYSDTELNLWSVLYKVI
jgi:hypothetical protein